MSSSPLAEQACMYLDTIVAAHTGGEPRAGQQQLCLEVAEAVAGGRHALAEAPTGTGKSFAYLAVAVAVSQRQDAESRQPVVIVTATKALQEQLVGDDLPAVAAALAPLGVTFTYQLLKGRSNYLCVARLSEHRSGAEQLFDVDAAGDAWTASEHLGRIEDWADITATGDRSEISPGVSDAAWKMVSIGAECPGRKRCSFGEHCFSEQARDRARRSDIIVVNAALYAADLAAGGHLLGEHSTVIIDEAHTFDSVVTDANTITISAGGVRSTAQAARRAGAGRDVCDKLSGAADALDGAAFAVDLERNGGLISFDAAWTDALAAVADSGEAVMASLEAAGDSAGKDRAEQASTALSKLVAAAGRVVSGHDGHAVWVREDRRGRRELVVAPIDITGLLAATMWDERCVVATSATLKHAGSLDGYARRTGVRDGTWAGVDVPSPFQFRENATLFVAKHLPDPRHETFEDAAQQLTAELIVAAGGRALVLFTSHRALRNAADALGGQLARHGIRVLKQGDDSRDVLVSALRSSAGTGGVAVFATQSFWTGVDVAGAGLSLVVIDKLPFARPDDPLSLARRARIEARGGNAFAELDVPRAAGLLAQGAGRLIRSVNDRGVVAVMDRRLAVAGYRNQLLGNLPPFRRSVSVTDTTQFLAEIRASAEASSDAAAAA